METIYQIFEYLPLKYKNPTDEEYFSFLINSVEQNYDIQNYHFAFVALHMIYMGIVYHYIYAIFRANPEKFNLTLIGFHDILQIKSLNDISWHTFSLVNESSIFQFFRAVGIQKDKIGLLKAPVKDRNNMVHANGVFVESKERFENLSKNYLENLKKINKFCFNEYKKLYINFLDGFNFGMGSIGEAEFYLIELFVKEYGINEIILYELLKYIGEEEYQRGKKRFYAALSKIVKEGLF